MLLLKGHRGKVHTLVFSPDGKTLASVAGHAHITWLWDLARGQPSEHAEHDRRVVSLAFSSDGDTLAWADSLGNLTLWDLAAGKKRCLGSVDPAPNHSVKLAFCPGVGSLACTGWYGAVGSVIVWRGWEAGGPAPRARLSRKPYRQLTCLAVSPDGRIVAAGCLDHNVHLWNISGVYLAPLDHGRKVHCVAYSPDGRTLASASHDGLVKVWDADTGRRKTTLKGQGKFLHAIAYSPDARSLATASGDGRVRFWDVETGRPLRAFDWGVGAVHSVAFAPDGMRAAAGGDGDIVVWDIDDWG